jgi:hypothetical protein
MLTILLMVLPRLPHLQQGGIALYILLASFAAGALRTFFCLVLTILLMFPPIFRCPQQGSMALYILLVPSFASSALNPAVVHLMS